MKSTALRRGFFINTGMKINEITGYRSHPVYQIAKHSTSIGDFMQAMRREGYKKYIIGDGLYAGVFMRSPEDNQVIKIFDTTDTGYKRYLDFVLKNKTNIHVPVIKGYPVPFLKKYTIVRMEKLRPYSNSSEYDQNIFTIIISLVRDIHSGKTNPKPSDLKKSIKEFKKSFPTIMPVLELLAKNYDSLDLHSKNIMFRGKIPVITDPFSDGLPDSLSF